SHTSSPMAILLEPEASATVIDASGSDGFAQKKSRRRTTSVAHHWRVQRAGRKYFTYAAVSMSCQKYLLLALFSCRQILRDSALVCDPYNQNGTEQGASPHE